MEFNLLFETAFPRNTLGTFPLKIAAFLSFHMHQAATMNTSMKKGKGKAFLANMIL
jgi:hypothetical protein